MSGSILPRLSTDLPRSNNNSFSSRLSLQLPMVSSTSSARPRKRLSLLRRPHTHHDISRPYTHTAHRVTTVFTPPSPIKASGSLKKTKVKPKRRDSGGNLRLPPRPLVSATPATPPPSPLVTIGFRLERPFSRARSISRSRPSTPRPVTPLTPLPDDDETSASAAPDTVRSCPQFAASSVSVAERKGHRRSLSNKVRSLLVGLMRKRDGLEDDLEEEEEDSGTFGAPLRPHRSPGAASFHVTTQLAPTRSSSPPSRTASFASRDSSPVPHLIVRPRTRRQLRLPERFLRPNDHHDADVEDSDDSDAEGEDQDRVEGILGASRPPTALSHRPGTSLSQRPPTITERPSVYVERPSIDSVRPPQRSSGSSGPSLHALVRNVSRASSRSRMSVGPSVASSRLSFISHSPRPSMETHSTLSESKSSTSIARLSESKSSISIARLSESKPTSITRPRKSRSRNKSKDLTQKKHRERDPAEPLESRFSDTSDSEGSVCGDLIERERPTSPFRRPWSSMPDLVRDQLRALKQRAKSPEPE